MLIFSHNIEEIDCDRAVKGKDYIHCYTNGNPIAIAEANGISDFSGYKLIDENGNQIDFETPMPTNSERLAATEAALLALMMGDAVNV